MENVFKSKAKHSDFAWENLGDIKGGRGELGESMPVLVYRMMQYTMLDVLSKDLGEEQANVYFHRAGFLSGTEFAKNVLNLDVDFDTFVAELQQKLQEYKIGILKMEAFDSESGNIILTVGEDLDCSGLPVTNENVCTYDEGFISGILNAYTGKSYQVKEIDCWANGDRVCRFSGEVSEDNND
ncbi:putative hydrocarbon binding protein [Lachnospiraceae bacterium PF1-21]|uniref:4-vinyl reductase n=1 Tax=Ohessyouella blattaphilus TaxID=2949333 RepID=A0ABT1ENJ9_9FIRM|nr:4-vinyl reductase [Ohessyouella blattaphilus]MCP1111286.1 4-vinyl reductase [Ohessyouella blattaphilus]MCR8564680.1 4-vinyl reductase [Ohessyouella blattaphilus]MDL2249727.1 4-vinyl reductase [Lachnospiraceae bacterium OttesenSCG-928-J05]